MTRAIAALVVTLATAVGASADPFADAVTWLTLGPLGGGGSADAVLGPPHGAGPFQGGDDTLSLGLRGRIDLAFTDNVVVDGPGTDFVVFENAFLVRGTTTLAPFAEPAWVSVSADGVTYRTFPCAIDVPPYHPGCAGIYPVFAIDAATALTPTTTPIDALVGLPVDEFVAPSGAGGDGFDLAAVGLHAARFVRIQGGAERWGLDGLGGFDLDALAAIHSVEIGDAADTDADGIPDAADGCPDVADAGQADGDGDGLGDACDPGGALADADADGVPDVLDRCDAIPDAAQDDRDADGVGDACDRCPGVPDPADDAPCPDAPADADFDGAPDALDPCPMDPACLPYAEGEWAGGGPRREADELLTWDVLVERRPQVADTVDRLTVFVAVASDVDAARLRLRVGRRDVTAELGVLTPGARHAITLDLPRRRTRVVAKARRLGARGRGSRDVDRFIIKKERGDS